MEKKMRDKIYPAIYESICGERFLYLDGENYHSTERDCWDVSGNDDNHASDTNITREYLQNTYGEVVSPEHAEFIIELCESNGFELAKQSKRLGNFFCFYVNKFCFLNVDSIVSQRCKKITIPLPPKAESKKWTPDFYDLGELPKHFDCVCNKCGGKCCTGQCGNKESSEWPQVGDEAIHQTHGLCNVVSPVDGLGIVTVINKQRINTLVFKSDLSKPKTPEEELRDDILDCDNFAITESKATQLANWLTNKGYEIKKKPQ